VVDAEGHVFCAKTLVGHPILAKPVEEALRQWPLPQQKSMESESVTGGTLQFTVCHICCGDAGHSMSILK
jgi:hypothetical protein